MTKSSIQLYQVGNDAFTTVSTETRDGVQSGDEYLYVLDFQGGTVSEIVIEGDFGGVTDATTGQGFFC